MQSCQSIPEVDWEPEFFNKEGAAIIASIVDVILPKTETPSATDLKVDKFVDLMFARALAPEDQAHIRKGFEGFRTTTQELFGRSFTQLSTEEKGAVLEKVGSETNQFNPSIWGSTLGVQPPIDFYRRLRQFTLLGYFTSEEIGKNVLAYDPIPGHYHGCTDLQPGQKLWSL